MSGHHQHSSSSDSPPATATGGYINVFWDDGMLDHHTGNGVFDSGIDPGFLDILEKHPENSDRIRNMLSILKRGPISPFISWHSSRAATVSELLSFHTQEYINSLLEADKNGGKMICSGTFLNIGSWNAALLAAGTALSAIKYILDGHGKICYALVRPPGHHAQPTQADGYCFLNNAGLAVQYALDSGCKRVAVIDIDVHYGNGTAEGFYHSDKVLTVSLHMNHGSWGTSHPQNGGINELGEGAGFGYNLNVPLPNGTGDKGYKYAMMEVVVPAVRKFDPDMMVFVVGQDSSAFDPNGRQCLTMEGYRDIGKIIHNLADNHSNGRILIVQEGGYHVTYSAYCLHATLEGQLNYTAQSGNKEQKTILNTTSNGYMKIHTDIQLHVHQSSKELQEFYKKQVSVTWLITYNIWSITKPGLDHVGHGRPALNISKSHGDPLLNTTRSNTHRVGCHLMEILFMD